MLVILSGSETINKEWWARKILATMNTFEIDDYTIDYGSDQFKVYDQDGNMVYQPHDDSEPGFPHLPSFLEVKNTGETTETDINKTPAPPATFQSGPGGHYMDGDIDEPSLPPVPPFTLEKIHYTYRTVFIDNIFNNNFHAYFTDVPHDFGQVGDDTRPEWETRGPRYLHVNGYQNIITNYNKRPTPVHVICGCFSRRVIQMIKKDLGEQNVKVINITRHPSVTCALHEKDATFYKNNPALSLDYENTKLIDSIITQVSLKRFNDIQHVKHEDALRDGFFMFEGKKIELPEKHKRYNKWITTWEFNHFNQHVVNNWRLGDLNQEFQNGSYKQQCESAGGSQMPENIFTYLGYDGPLQRTHIASPDNT